MPAVTDPMLPRRFRVLRAWDELGDARSLELEPVDGVPLPFQPGQFNMLYAFGIGEVAISISSDPSEWGRLIHTIRAVGAVTEALCKLEPGQMLGLRGPFGSAWPVEAAKGRHVVLVAGGLGLAPLRPAIIHVLNNRADYAGMTLVYGARSPEDLLYPDQLMMWKARFDTEVEVTVDHARHGWTGRVGIVTTALERALAGVDSATVTAFICGPEVMMRFTAAALTEAGVAASDVHVSMERNMKCALGFCGHCQYGADFVCRDGPVFSYDQVARRLSLKEI